MAAISICSTEFIEQAFRTDSYRLEIDFADDGSWSYSEHLMMKMPGQDEPFKHEDRNRLVKVGEADINPWLKIVRAQSPAG